MATESYVDLLKESLAATQLFDMSADDYIFNLDRIYCDRFCKLLYRLSVFLKDKCQASPEDTLQLITEFYEKFEENKNILFSCVEDFISTSIFRVPKPVVLPIDQEINEKIREYSEAEDAELDQKIESLIKGIKSKKAYATLLKKRILMLEEGRKFLNPNLEILNKIAKK